MSEQKNIGVPASPVVTLDQTGMDEHQRNVREAYARVAQASDTGCGVESGCCGVSDDTAINTLLSTRLGYSKTDLDLLPGGADLAWISAIVHQNSRAQNRELFGKVAAALVPGGRVLIRDIVMDESRTRPVGGALFAINMLVNTESGGTFTFDELADDLQAAGFVDPQLAVPADDMNAVVSARKA